MENDALVATLPGNPGRPGRRRVLAGVAIDNLSFEEAIGELRSSLLQGRRGFVVTPNADHVCMLQRDPELKALYEKASFVLTDGMSIVLASRLLGHPIKERCCGTDLFTSVCAMLAPLSQRIFLLGGQDGSERVAARKLQSEYPGLVVDAYSPAFGFESDPGETERIVARINRGGTDVLFVFVGTPKSEKWIYRNFSRLHVKMAFSLGQTLNFYSGRKRRAPRWMQRAGLEWLFRLCQEPRRLWKRYLFGNTRFLILVVKELLRIRPQGKTDEDPTR